MLKVENVSIVFGALRAVNNVSLEIEDGKITALIGPNGAGKTTLFNAISGAVALTEGKVVFDDYDISGMPPYKINKRGINRTYQIINIFRKMTVIENVLVGMHSTVKSGFVGSLLRFKSQRSEEKELLEKAYALLEFAGIEEHANDLAESLPYGKQRLLEIVRGLASKPKLLLLDEPAAGMNTREKQELNGLIRKIKDQGVTVLIVEHDMQLVMDIADYLYVLNSGKLISQGTPEYIQADPVVIAAYLGGDDDDATDS